MLKSKLRILNRRKTRIFVRRLLSKITTLTEFLPFRKNSPISTRVPKWKKSIRAKNTAFFVHLLALPKITIPQINLLKTPKVKQESSLDDTGKQYIFTVSEAAKFLGVSSDTLRNWEASRKLIPQRTRGGQRRYRLAQLQKMLAVRNPVLYEKVKESNEVLQSLASQGDALQSQLTSTSTSTSFWRGTDSASTTNIWQTLASFFKPTPFRLAAASAGLIGIVLFISQLSNSDSKVASQGETLRGYGGKNANSANSINLDKLDKSSGSVLAALSEASSNNYILEINTPANFSQTLHVNGQEVLTSSGAFVKSLQGKSGSLTLEEGTGIDIEGLKISFGGCTACLTDSDIKDELTISSSGSVAVGALSGTVAIGKGGTGLTSYTKGDLVYSSAADTLAKLAIGTAGQALLVGSSGVPEWGQGSQWTTSGTTIYYSSGNVGIGTASPTSTLSVSGTANITGNVTLGDATTDTITFTGRAASDIIPSTSGSYALGSSALPWSQLYLSGVATIGGQSTFTSTPTGTAVDKGVIYINPASNGGSGSNTVFGIAVADIEKLRMDASGNITIGGDLIGPTGGSVGYWTRSGTTISPATSNDVISYSSNNTTSVLSLTASGAAADAFKVVADSVTTGNAASISADGLTTGDALEISSTSTAGGLSGASYLINLARSGTNASASHTAYGLYSAVTNTGTTSTNTAAYFTASGATTNYALYS
ncbi:MAG: MerR family DNA-binding transcriptional regulator, partial [Candidatus Blackburnbacteria bacterium]|nr:MerR family DNA-binding transcriptional regulator [Candidatus Blackburnbacteria bacterium]